ncbi:Rossmann-fold NAD(P)-binding domain-containing protein [Robiginitomaculum antarcticum]|uniref:hypothetical protein n=1 Tax=Robiginitomaculum antarcticum TaxID=437507 RepID=UPI00035FE33D|nr:hypothetical protein [Robiginitomaculum antarcticum]
MQSSIKHQQGKIALIGAGYVARAMIPALQAAGWAVLTTHRNLSDVQDGGDIERHIYDSDKGLSVELRAALRGCTAVLSSIAPRGNYDPFILDLDIHDLGAETLPDLHWAGYLSATSVYGDRAGQWAFEDELLLPVTARGRRRVLAELDWMESGLPVHIFRLAGIYGPGRAPFDKIMNGEAKVILKEGHVVNRIHVDDIVTAVMASLSAPFPCTVYNIADGHPAPPGDVLDYAATLCGYPPPPRFALEDAGLSDMARSFYRENKRVSINRAVKGLKFKPKYPDYKSGLDAIWANRRR